MKSPHPHPLSIPLHAMMQPPLALIASSPTSSLGVHNGVLPHPSTYNGDDGALVTTCATTSTTSTTLALQCNPAQGGKKAEYLLPPPIHISPPLVCHNRPPHLTQPSCTLYVPPHTVMTVPRLASASSSCTSYIPPHAATMVPCSCLVPPYATTRTTIWPHHILTHLLPPHTSRTMMVPRLIPPHTTTTMVPSSHPLPPGTSLHS